MRHTIKNSYYFYNYIQFIHNIIGMHKNKYCFDTIAMSSSGSSTPPNKSSPPAHPEVEDTATVQSDPMEEGSEVDKDEDIVVVAATDEETSDLELSNLTEENPGLATYLSKLDRRITAAEKLSSKNQVHVRHVRFTQLGVTSRLRRVERDGVKG